MGKRKNVYINDYLTPLRAKLMTLVQEQNSVKKFNHEKWEHNSLVS